MARLSTARASLVPTLRKSGKGRARACAPWLEDDLGVELIHTLDEQQQGVAIVDPTAYRDILTAASRKAALQGQPSGLSTSKMNARQFDVLKALMEEYARNVPDELAEGRMEQINKAGRNI